ncbi:MAG: hypothetical protein IIU80_02430 [Clostridia bacterium]|nr:hypothetical protein [Clostridia bacterium]
MKKLLSTVISIIIAISALTVPAFAVVTENAIWSGSIAKMFSGGTGVSDDPYLISTADELALVANMVNNKKFDFAGMYIKLKNDIYLNDTTNWEKWDTVVPKNEWTPIGTPEFPFAGFFDGGQFVIYGIYVNDVDYAGLFGYCSNATINNTIINQSYISGNYAGGIGGYINDTNVTMCANAGIVNGVGEQGYAGGLFGYIYATKTKTVSKSFNSGEISGVCVGGLTGFYSTAYESYTYNYSYFFNKPYLTFNNCYNSGNINATDYAGGLFGYIGSKATGHETTSYYITESYSTGIVYSDNIAGQLFGGIINIYDDAVCNNLYYHNPIPYPQLSAGWLTTEINNSIALSNNQMQDKNYFSSLWFDVNWTMDGNYDYFYPEIIGNNHIDNKKHIHNYILDTITQPTCIKDGSASYSCRCGDVYIKTLVASHDYLDGFCINCDTEANALSSIKNVTYIQQEDTHKRFTVTCNGRASMIQFIEPDYGTRTYYRNNANVKITSYNADGEVVGELSRDLAYEVWEIYSNMSIGTTIKVRAKFNNRWELDKRSLVVYEYNPVISMELSRTSGKKGPVPATVVADEKTENVKFKMPNGTSVTVTQFTTDENGNRVFKGNAWANEDGLNVITVTIRRKNVTKTVGTLEYTVE